MHIKVESKREEVSNEEIRTLMKTNTLVSTYKKLIRKKRFNEDKCSNDYKREALINRYALMTTNKNCLMKTILSLRRPTL